MGVRTLIGHALGLSKQIEDLEARIRELSWDAPFGMWTRNAFEQFCRVMPRDDRAVAFVDLEDIHSLNHRLGYAEVDRRIRSTFAIPFRVSDVVARWYSGDEIVILFDGDETAAARKIEELRASAASCGLRFSSAIGTWAVGRESVREVIEALSARVAATRAKDGVQAARGNRRRT